MSTQEGSRHVVLLTAVVAALLFASPASFGQEAAPQPSPQTPASGERVLVGASYFAGWWRPTPNKWLDSRGQDWRERFAERIPLLGEYNDQPTMDREIAAAAKAGLDYFAILWYPVDPEREPEPGARFLNEGLACLLRSPEAPRIKFFVEYCNHPPFSAPTDEQWNRCVDTWLAAMRHPSYLRVGGRAVFKVHSGWGFVEQCGGLDAARQRLDGLREAARNAGVGELVIGGGVGSSEPIPAGHWAPQLYQFTSCYMDVPPLPQQADDYPYQVLADWTRTARQKHQSDAIPYVPYLPAGWNPRPWPDRRARFQFPRGEEWTGALGGLKEDLASSKPFGFPLPDGKIQKAFTIYAWNEFGEGGILAPTRGEGTLKLDAIGTVFPR